MTNYEVVIGLEIHVQMNTKTKLFCGCDNDSFNKPANSNVCEICMGFPGALPIINQEAINKGITAGLALNCSIPPLCKFDRKHYFYPDSPKGFQITQYDEPIAINGHMDIQVDGQKKRIGIERLHLEDDAGKLIHAAAGTMVDFNRSGTPLMEIVSKPDMRSKEEASQYARNIQQIMRFVKSSDADMEKGMMRFDLNISLRPLGQEAFGNKVEVKNLNSFRALEKAIVFEIDRQTKILETNGVIVKETRGWDANKEISESQRSKEDAADYRYFPEPDLPPITIAAEQVDAFKKALPELPQAKQARYREVYVIDPDQARIISQDFELAQFFEAMMSHTSAPITAANLLTTDIIGYLNQAMIPLDELKISAAQLASLASMINNNEISSKMAKEILKTMLETGKDAKQIMDEQGLKQVNDNDTLEKACQAAIEAMPQAANDIRNGNPKAIGALVGFVMKETKGQANPGKVNQILLHLLKH